MNGHSIVLVVDDEPDQRHLLRTLLERAGCQVLAAESADNAMALAEIADLDLAFVDLMMPGVDGWKLAEKLRLRQPNCPVIITSVLDVETYPACQGALPKPFSRDQLRAVLAAHLPNWRPA